jgi:DNA invertase Pin-like site-specific DNA recombinase
VPVHESFPESTDLDDVDARRLAGRARRQGVIGYVRVSRINGRHGDGYITIPFQKRDIEAMATLMGTHVTEYLEDEDWSGGNDKRPQWNECIRRVEAGETGGVIVAKLDRFARSAIDGPRMVKRIMRSGGAFASAHERIDPTSDTGWAMMQVIFVMAELQLNTLKSGWKDAKEQAISRGAHIGRTPIGMLRRPKGERSGVLEPDPQWVPLLRRLFDYAASHPHAGERALMRWANDHVPRPDGKQWASASIGNLLRNRVYLGEIAYRPLPAGKSKSDDTFKPLHNAAAHEAVIDEVTFARAQRRGGRPVQPIAPRAARISPLQGILRCAGCQHTMIPTSGPNKKPGYRCDKHFADGVCPSPSTIQAHIVEPYVVDYVRRQFELRMRHASVDDDGAAATLLATTEVELTEARADLDAIEKNTRLMAREPDSWERGVVAEKLAAFNEAAQASGADEDGQLEPVDWDTITPQELRDRILPALLDCVMIRSGRGRPVADRAFILWRGEADVNLPGRGRPAEIRSFEWNEPTAVPVA